jgi:hypothetical protein
MNAVNMREAEFCWLSQRHFAAQRLLDRRE